MALYGKQGGATGNGIDDAEWEAFCAWCRQRDIAMPGALRKPLGIYRDLLHAWNERTNLTAIRAPREVLIKHFFDSLTPLKHLHPGGAPGAEGGLLDIGSGPGFPGLVLKIARPALPVTLVEARSRKVAFLEQVRRALGLKGCAIVHRYLEPGDPQFSGRFMSVVSRAFREPGGFLALARGCVGPGGRAIAMLGGKATSPEKAAALAREAGGRLAALETLALPEGAGDRQLLAVAWPDR